MAKIADCGLSDVAVRVTVRPRVSTSVGLSLSNLEVEVGWAWTVASVVCYAVGLVSGVRERTLAEGIAEGKIVPIYARSAVPSVVPILAATATCVAQGTDSVASVFDVLSLNSIVIIIIGTVSITAFVVSNGIVEPVIDLVAEDVMAALAGSFAISGIAGGTVLVAGSIFIAVVCILIIKIVVSPDVSIVSPIIVIFSTTTTTTKTTTVMISSTITT